MKRPNRGCLVFLLTGVLGAMAGTAWAQEAPAAPAPAAAPAKFLGDKQGYFISGGVGDDIIEGDGGSDYLYGDDGHDTIYFDFIDTSVDLIPGFARWGFAFHVAGTGIAISQD